MDRTKLAIGVATLAVIGAAPAAAHDEAAPRTLSVAATAEVAAAPDLAQVQLGATAQQPDAAAAQRRVNEVVSAAVRAIVALGVSDESLQTSQLTLHPVYADRSPGPRGGGPDPEPRIVGYRATNTIQVEVRELALLGEVLDAGVAAGANEVRGIEFRLEDDEPHKLQALRVATGQAMRKAGAIAGAAGVRLAGLRTLSEGEQQILQPQLRMSHLAMAGEASGTPVLPGQVSVRASVTLVYDLGD